MRNLSKLVLFIMFAVIIAVSCNKEEEEKKDSTVEITVENLNGEVQSNTTVYMFKEPATETFGNKPIYAKKESVTDENGVAKFELLETIDLDPINSQTTLYFTCLTKLSSTSYSVDGTIGITITNGENYSKTLKLNN